jgi:tetratricopeptide (TPR) repeat protein/DNA-binding XRE family transcriptional regulator
VSGEGAAAFGQLLRRRRRASGLSQEELAERAGVGVRTICDLERGQRTRPYRQTIGSLAEALGLRGLELDEFVRLSRQGRGPVPDDGQTVAAESGGWAVPKTAAGPPNATTVPRQLPAAVSHFTGRARELDALTSMLDESGAARTVVICALAGTAGVGKTATAVHWAHQVAGLFPDGQLYVNLHGYDMGEPVSAADALAAFLRALGVPGHEVPDEPEDRAGLYRSRLAGQRMLVMLDNARDAAQVRPLLPGDPGCVVVVTSRDALAGLVAADGARRVALDVLPLAEAVGLLQSLTGPRADEDPQSAAELARLCARLPLALRIAAELAIGRPAAPLRELATELAGARLDVLDAGEDRADIRAVFSWSTRQLPDYSAEAFALIGLHPGDDLGVHAAAALTGTTPAQARQMLRQLHRASLLQATGPGRYGMHDLLRAHAREQAASRDVDASCEQALTRLFDYYLAAAAAAMAILVPAEAHVRPRVSAAPAVLELPNDEGARAWLDAERANLVAMAAYCAGHGRGQHTVGLARTIFRYLMMGSHLPEAQAIYGHTLQTARLSGDLAAEAEALNGLGSVAGLKGRFGDAAVHYQMALECYSRCGDRAGEARVLNNLGITEQRLHNHQSAARYHRQAIAAYEDAGDGFGAARALAELASVETALELLDDAAEHLQRALRAFRDARDRAREAEVLSRIGELSLRRGQLAEAAGYFERSLAIFYKVGNPTGIAAQLYNLGDVSLRQARYQQATSYKQQALDQFRQADDKYGETLTLRSLAEALHGTGRTAAARAELETAVRLAAETGNIHEQAYAHRDLAESHHSDGQDDQARYHWQQALDLFTLLRAPEADQVQSLLSKLKAGTLD